MFPGCLAEGPFSLRPSERGTALSLSAELSPEGEMQNPSIVASHVVPTEKITYDELDEAVASGSSNGISEALQTLLEVLHALQSSTLPVRVNVTCLHACQCICQANFLPRHACVLHAFMQGNVMLAPVGAPMTD